MTQPATTIPVPGTFMPRRKKIIRDIRLSISGWIIDREKASTDIVVRDLLARIERLESVAGEFGSCHECDRFFRKHEWLFFGENKLCLECFDFAITDPHRDDDAIKPIHLARRLLQLGLHHRDPERFDHICGYVDCGEEGDEDFVDLRAIVQQEAK